MVDRLSPEEVKEKIEGGECQVVDIRNPNQFGSGHVPGAINIPMADLPERIDEVEWGDDIVVVCPIGESSVQAARLIKSFEGVGEDACVASMDGGYREWSYELETD